MSSLKSRLVRLGKRVDSHGKLLAKEGYKNVTRFSGKEVGVDGIVINAVNYTGEAIEPFTCVNLVESDFESQILRFYYAEDIDEDEYCIYGSLLNYTPDGQTGMVQISGRALLRIYKGAIPIIVGEKLYPLPNAVGTKGLVSTIGNSGDCIGNGIGRALKLEGTNTVLMEVYLGGVGGGGGTVSGYNVRVATTGSITLNDLQIVDGISLAVGDLVAVWNQADPIENGMYEVAEEGEEEGSGDWTLDEAFDLDSLYKPIFVGEGNKFGRTEFFVTDTDTIKWRRSNYFVKVATTADHGLTGTANVDSQSIAAEDLVLVWKQNTTSQNGIYVVKSTGDWTKIVSFDVNDIGITVGVALGTLYGKLNFVVTAANTVVAMGGVWL